MMHLSVESTRGILVPTYHTNHYRRGRKRRGSIQYIMVKKSAISGEYIITIEDSDAVRVCQIFDNVIGSLREAAKSVSVSNSQCLICGLDCLKYRWRARVLTA